MTSGYKQESGSCDCAPLKTQPGNDRAVHKIVLGVDGTVFNQCYSTPVKRYTSNVTCRLNRNEEFERGQIRTLMVIVVIAFCLLALATTLATYFGLVQFLRWIFL